MGAQSVMSFKITPSRRVAMDAVRAALRNDDLGDSSVLDFALEWALVTMPEQYTPRQCTAILNALARHMDGGRVMNDADVTQVRAAELDMVRERHQGSAALRKTDADERKGHHRASDLDPDAVPF